MASRAVLAELLDEGARRILESSGEAEESNEHPYRLTMSIADEVASLHGPKHEPKSSGAAYAVLMQISDLADHPNGPLSFELCQIVAREFAVQWVALDDRGSERTQRMFLHEKWYKNFDTIVEQFQSTKPTPDSD